EDISVLSADEDPTRAERSLLRMLSNQTNVLGKNLSDGKTLAKLNSALRRRPDYLAPLDATASNLLTGFNVEYEFIGERLLPELPPSPETTVVTAQFNAFASIAVKLNLPMKIAKFANQYDATRRKLDTLFFQANQALNFPFPTNLPLDSVSAKINNTNFLTSAGAASGNFFQAVATDSNISLTISGLATSGAGPYPRGILLSLPNAKFGTFRYTIPADASLTNRTGVYSPELETNVGATNGVVFVSQTTNEVYGLFDCSGPGFNITGGRFRIRISSQP
ncbi:MAG TPA: hypothetical protein VK846_06335, partial [Candidatus Limnocylindria bacterium]|nr:hypothetical protein [Candidatus Limnocylindria bacterium]